MGSFRVLASWRHFFVLLVLVAQASESRQIETKMYSVEKETLRRSWYFNIKDMKEGTRKAINFPTKEESIGTAFIPKAKADSIPFLVKELPEILRLFDIAKDSKQAAAIEARLKDCESPPASEVFKACFTSYESMIESVQRFFETSDRPTMMTSVFRGDHNSNFQNYTVSGAPQEVATPKMMGCHALDYPYAVFYCHVQPGETKVLKIPLVTDDGVQVDAVAACHFDTSLWDPDNRSFLTLGSKPGQPVCHFFPPYDNFAWVHTSDTTSASANKATI